MVLSHFFNDTFPFYCAAVVEIGSEDTKCFSHDLPIDSDLSNNNADPDLEILENLPLKVVLSHSNFDLHPDDLGFYHYTPPPKKAKELYEAYEKGLVSLSRYYFDYFISPTIFNSDLVVGGIQQQQQQQQHSLFSQASWGYTCLNFCDTPS